MAALRDSLFRAVQAEIDAGRGLALALRLRDAPGCCPGMAGDGMLACTCWTPVYDLPQTDPDSATLIALLLGDQQPPQRERMCHDCAYRPGSPEKTGDEAYAGDPQELERLAREDRFWCHDGMRQPTSWLHPPTGVTIAAVLAGDYQPPIIEGIPWRADGQPGLLCAGWAARRRALTAGGA